MWLRAVLCGSDAVIDVVLPAISSKQSTALLTELTVCMLAQQQDAAFDDDIRVVQLAALDFAKYDNDDYVEAYMGEMHRSPRASLKAAAWNALLPSEQALWDKFSPEGKEMIQFSVRGPCRR